MRWVLLKGTFSMQELRDQALQMIDDSEKLLRDFIGEVGEEERHQVGTPEKWSFKDNVSHLTFWMETAIRRIEDIQHHQPVTFYPDFQKRNEEAFEARRHLSWEQVTADLDYAFSKLRALVSQLSDEQLTVPLNPDNPGAGNLWSTITGNGFQHFVEHIAAYYAEHGDLTRSTALQERILSTVGNLGTPRDQGVTRYNVACHFAKNGIKQRALELLPRAFELAPDLVEWSQKDSDLDSLRDEDAYKALLTTPA
jgi:hypothetical protein